MKTIKAASAAQINPGEKLLVRAEGKEILLVNIGGAFYAVDNACPHMGGSLYEGKLEGTQTICPKHGSTFDITTGKVTERGKLLFLKVPVHDLRTYPVRQDGEDILIDIG